MTVAAWKKLFKELNLSIDDLKLVCYLAAIVYRNSDMRMEMMHTARAIEEVTRWNCSVDYCYQLVAESLTKFESNVLCWASFKTYSFR